MSTRSAGRPRTSSRALIEDAAAELFLENTYGATTIDQIAQRAGVSRNTFFNYFTAKSDLLWGELDAAIDRLEVELRTVAPDADALPALRATILAAVADIGVDRVPLALTQEDVMGTREETRSSGLTRYARRADVIAAFLARQQGLAPDDLTVLATANAISGAISAAWTVWARAGVQRHPLSEYVARALDAL
ncbi:MAG: TetR family transcriptional regulator [Lacisediminihabitans sp.]